VSPTKRLRIFAGPNGSGKSTLVKVVEKLHVDLGVFINADDIKAELNYNRFLDFTEYGLNIDIEHFVSFFKDSTLFILSNGAELLKGLNHKENRLLLLNQVSVNDYFTSFFSQPI